MPSNSLVHCFDRIRWFQVWVYFIFVGWKCDFGEKRIDYSVTFIYVEQHGKTPKLGFRYVEITSDTWMLLTRKKCVCVIQTIDLFCINTHYLTTDNHVNNSMKWALSVFSISKRKIRVTRGIFIFPIEQPNLCLDHNYTRIFIWQMQSI